jgi:hypothetical protein
VSFETPTLKQRPDLEEQVHRLNGESWPTFLLHGDITHWESLFDEFEDYQILFCEPADAVISVGLTIPFVWDDFTNDLPSTMAELILHWRGSVGYSPPPRFGEGSGLNHSDT